MSFHNLIFPNYHHTKQHRVYFSVMFTGNIPYSLILGLKTLLIPLTARLHFPVTAFCIHGVIWQIIFYV